MKMNKSYYAIIPANVRYDSDLPPNAKLLYGEITALCNERGYCWAGNNYFAELYNVTKETISRWISKLAERKYIKIQMIYKEGTKQIVNRYIQINHDPIDKIINTSQHNSQEPIDEIINTPIDEIVKDNTTSLNTTVNNTSDTKRIINPVSFYEKNGYGMIAPLTIEKISDWVSDISDTGVSNNDAKEVVVKAMEFGVTNNKRNWNYVNKILINWKQKGLNTLEKIEAAEVKREEDLAAKKRKPAYAKQSVRKESLPDWADENKQKEKDKKISEGQQAAFKERLQKIRAQRKG